MLNAFIKNSAQAKAPALVMACTSLVALGVVAIPTPSYAWPKSIRASIFASALDPTGNTSPGDPISGTDFLDSDFYRFDFSISNNNTPTINTSTATQWGPNNSTNTNLTGSLFTNLTIGRCNNGSLVDCNPNVVQYGVVGGTWNTDPTWGSGTDLQKFGVKIPSSGRTVGLNLSFGASNGVTGLTSTFNNAPGKSISNIDIGCDVSQSMCMSDLSNLTFNNAYKTPGWSAVGTGISNLTATNIINNLGLTLNVGKTYTNTTTTPMCIPMMSSSSCNLAIRFKDEAGAIYFNINTVRFEYVPGPLPVSAAFVAFGYSRKLRKRIKSPVS